MYITAIMDGIRLAVPADQCSSSMQFQVDKKSVGETIASGRSDPPVTGEEAIADWWGLPLRFRC